MDASALWSLVRRAAKKHLGIALNPHQFRHIVTSSYLLERPGDGVTMANVLGHKSSETTIPRYTCITQTEAMRAFDAMRRPA